MTGVFADTSYFVALIVKRDRHHQRVVEWSRQSLRPVVTTEYVLVELANYLSASARRDRVVRFLREVPDAPGLHVVEASSKLYQRGLTLFAERMDKHWSLTDCISFVVMRDYGLTEALSFDTHFEQAGLSLVLK